MTRPTADLQSERPETTSTLLAWYDRNRRDLPWRPRPGDASGHPLTREPSLERELGLDPYRVWVAEVMLIQTQVNTVVPYYRRFLDLFPDVQALAAADLDEVLKLWEGLGYYARARNLHKAAQQIVDVHDGVLPPNRRSLRELPGAGDYVAAAVASIAFGERVLAIDANVRRVLSRLHDLAEPSDAQVRKLGTSLVDCDRPGDVNQALMDLGSTVCTPRNPSCPTCPLDEICMARARGTQSQRPGPKRSRARPHYQIAAGIIWRDGQILIAKRPSEGLLGGLWEFPGGKVEPGERLESAMVREVREELGVDVEPRDEIAAIKHSYSHFSITLHAFNCRYLAGEPQALGCQEFAWVKPEDLAHFAFPAANRRLIEKIAPSS